MNLSFFCLPVKPLELDINIGEAIKEGATKSVACKASSSNPSTSVGMELLIDGMKEVYSSLQEKHTRGPHKGMVKRFIFTFTTDRSQNGKLVKCHLLWDGKYIQVEKEAYLNITCKPQFLAYRFNLILADP